jgi:hypothetical protein
MHVHLLVPDLCHPELLAPEVSGTRIQLASAEMLVARGRRSLAPTATGTESWLKARFGVDSPDDSGFAAWSLLGDGLAPGDSAWLRADPVHLRVNRDALMLADATLFGISSEEAEGLIGHLNKHFAPALEFLPGHPRRWYTKADGAALPNCTPPAQARGRAVSAHLPAGVNAMRWHALMNEVQMALHDHPVNEARESRGELPVNSIWFWGGGVLQQPPSRPFDQVYSDDPLARGLALASGASAAPLPEDAAALLSTPSDSGRVLVVLDALSAPLAYGDGQAWSAQAARLERLWFAPLLAALRAERIGMITLHMGMADGGLSTETVRNDLRRFWRRSKPLTAYSAVLPR